jgi:DNA repair protein RadC
MAWLVKLVREPMTSEEAAAFRLAPRIHGPQDVVALMRPLVAKEPQEVVWAILLAPSGKVLDVATCTRGTVSCSLLHPREVFRPAILAGAVGVIVVHNHPSGACEPSTEDRLVTRQLDLAGQAIGITLQDHVILGEEGYFSFKEAGLL